MKINDLLKELIKINIEAKRYSINSGLKIDAHILEENHGIWEYYYYDEKGIKNETTIFSNEEDACLFLLEQLKKEVNETPTRIFNNENEARLYLENIWKKKLDNNGE